jgi:hypothetical protein
MVYPGYLAGARYGEPPPTPRTCDNKTPFPGLDTVTPFTTKKLFGTCAKRSPFGITAWNAICEEGTEASETIQVKDNRLCIFEHSKVFD